MNIQTEIERFILDELLMGSRPTLDPEEPLFSNGMLDSLGTLRLITFLEERFNLQVGDGEVGDENFKTVSRIQAFVERKQAGPAEDLVGQSGSPSAGAAAQVEGASQDVRRN